MVNANALELPRVLFMGFSEADPRLHQMQRLVGAWRSTSPGAFDDGARATDWEVLVVEGQMTQVPGHLQVVTFAGTSFGGVANVWGTVALQGTPATRSLRIEPGLPPDIRSLSFEEALPVLTSQQPLRHLTLQHHGYVMSPPPGSTLATAVDRASLRPFVTDTDGNILLGAFRRSDTKVEAWCWVIPYVSRCPARWLEAALKELAATRSERRRDPTSGPGAEVW